MCEINHFNETAIFNWLVKLKQASPPIYAFAALKWGTSLIRLK